MFDLIFKTGFSLFPLSFQFVFLESFHRQTLLDKISKTFGLKYLDLFCYNVFTHTMVFLASHLFAIISTWPTNLRRESTIRHQVLGSKENLTVLSLVLFLKI